MENISEDIRENLKTLGFIQLEKMPKLKEIKKAYFTMSKELHPDKHMDENEETKKEYEEKFKILLSAYTNVSIYIIDNGTDKDDVDDEDDEEEILVRKEFKNVNLVQANQNSVTLSIPKNHTSIWIEVLEEKYGSPRDQGRNGIQFKTEHGVSVKLWKKMRAKKDTILVDGNRDHYLSFADSEIIKLFKIVLEKCRKGSELQESEDTSRARNRLVECNHCKFIGNRAKL